MQPTDGHVLSTDLGDAGVLGKHYRYTATVRDRKTGQQFVLDPDVRVDP